MGCGPIDPGSNPGGGLLGELLRLSSTRSDWTLVDSTCRLSLVPHHVRPDPSYRLNSTNSRRCRLRGNSEAIEGRKGYVLAGASRRSPSASACRSPPFRRDTAPWPSRRAVPPRPASRGPCVDMLEMSGSETTTLGIGQAALSLPAASEALLKPPMWTCVNFLSESYISRGGGSLAWFRGHGPDYGWRPSTHMRRKPLIPGGDPPGVRIPAAAPSLRPH